MGMDYETYRLFGLDRLARLDVNRRSRADFVATLNPPEDVNYNPCPEANPLAADVIARTMMTPYVIICGANHAHHRRPA